MGQLRDRMMHDLELAGYVPKTRLVYLNSIRDFATYHRRSPTLLGPDDVRAWIDKRMTDGTIGPQRIRQHMAALKFLYTKTLWKPENVSFLAWPSDPKRLPAVLAAEEIERLLAAFTHAKYRVFFTLVYAAGLRLTEARRLETRGHPGGARRDPRPSRERQAKAGAVRDAEPAVARDLARVLGRRRVLWRHGCSRRARARPSARAASARRSAVP